MTGICISAVKCFVCDVSLTMVKVKDLCTGHLLGGEGTLGEDLRGKEETIRQRGQLDYGKYFSNPTGSSGDGMDLRVGDCRPPMAT